MFPNNFEMRSKVFRCDGIPVRVRSVANSVIEQNDAAGEHRLNSTTRGTPQNRVCRKTKKVSAHWTGLNLHRPSLSALCIRRP
jgi:hypothetical protein